MSTTIKLDSYGKFKVEEQRKFKNNVWTSYKIIDAIKKYIKDNNLTFKKALDPCAGSGRLIEEFNDYEWTGYEISETIFNECIKEETKQKVKLCDFFESEDKGGYDVCICNPPFNKSGGMDKWVKKILGMSGYLFLIVPYNFIKNIKSYKPIDVMSFNDDEMDRNYFSKICVYVFDKNQQESKFLNNPLFYINLPKPPKDKKPIYLKDFVDVVEVKGIKKNKIEDVPEGTKHPVYTVANNPVKYTDLSPNAPGDVLLFVNTRLSQKNVFKYSEKPPFLNDSGYAVFKFKNEDLKKYFLHNIFSINKYLCELFINDNLSVLLNKLDILEIPIYIEETSEECLKDEFKKFIKRFKFYDYIAEYTVKFK